MESRQRRVWHQSEGGMHALRDAIRPLGDYILTCGEITYQSFGLDKTPMRKHRSFGGECEPTHLLANARRFLHPGQKQGQPEGCPCFWLGWPDSDRRMRESKSRALPLGYIPILSLSSVFALERLFVFCSFLCAQPKR